MFFFFFKQKTAYEMRISDWSPDVCSSDLGEADRHAHPVGQGSCQRLKERGHARRHPIEPAFPVVVGHRLYSLQIACPAMAMPSAGTRTPKNAGERGGQRESTGWSGRSEAQPSEP